MASNGSAHAAPAGHADEYKNHLFPPNSASQGAHVSSREQYDEMYKRSITDPDSFWGEIAESFYWKKRWQSPVRRFNFDVRKGPVKIEWFVGAETNLSYNCLDRHVEAGHGDRVAFYWEGNDLNEDSKITYSQLLKQVCQLANYLKSIGVKRGSDVTIYMPMVPELPAAMLACARIGAVHSVVFGGFSAESLAGRILDSKPSIVITASAVKRGAKPIDLKGIVDTAVKRVQAQGHSIKTVLVFDHVLAAKRENVAFTEGLDVWWQDVVPRQPTDCPVEWMGAEEPLFKLYTSGSTGKPKGVEHTLAGYMIGASTTFKYVFDHRAEDIYWCTADCGWITGHSYVAYGPMVNGATQVLFEGVPTYPDAGRAWDIVDKYKVTLLYTAPTAIRALQSFGDSFVTKYSRKSLRILGTVGEPINPEAWKWYHEVVGEGRCPIVDTWWQTETGAHMITPLPGATTLKPGSATLPFFGVEPAVLNEKGEEQEGECEGYLVIKKAWPSSMRTLSGDHERFETTYFKVYPGYYFTGDGCRRDKDGYYWLIGRVDDVINVSGHRIGTAEVEGALTQHPQCAEAAVVPMEHPIKGQGIYAYVTLMVGTEYPPPASLKKELIATVREEIGPIATPDVIHWAPGLPKTRSGKIMRRILRKIASKEEDQLGDTSTLADPSVVQTLLKMRGQ
ncbi:g13299 [Coccomyxa viridis]|uniref:acetate--CoA ligase n=1 Tax=Coccomyxa viridis TaxID=1274662 RepID=A0ABP1GF33_9CHLO